MSVATWLFYLVLQRLTLFSSLVMMSSLPGRVEMKMGKCMKPCQNKHVLWSKALVLTMVCLFACNTLLWSYTDNNDSSFINGNTLAAQSIFKPLADEGIETSAELEFELIAGIRLLLADKSPIAVNGFLTEMYEHSKDMRKIEFKEVIKKDPKNITATFTVLHKEKDNDKDNVVFEIEYQDTVTDEESGDKSVIDTVLPKIEESKMLKYVDVFQKNDIIKIKKVSVEECVAKTFINYADYFIDQSSAANVDEVGLKGYNLLIMKSLGLPIPEFMIVGTELLNKVGEKNIDFDALAGAILENFASGTELAIRPAGTINMPGILPTLKGVSDKESLVFALRQIYNSWNDPVATIYRKKYAPRGDGLAIVVQRVVHGDRGGHSASGAFYTRNPITGDNELFGNYYLSAPGEKIMDGDQNPNIRHIPDHLQNDFPGLYPQIEAYKSVLEKHYQYPQEVEFVIEDGKFYILQTVDATDMLRNVEERILAAMYYEGIISQKRLVADSYEKHEQDAPLVVVYDVLEGAKYNTVAIGEPLSPGAIDGNIVFSLEEALKVQENDGKAILVVKNMSDDVLQAIIDRRIGGLITLYGNYNMHAARLARQSVIPAIAILEDGTMEGPSLIVNGITLNAGSRVIIDGFRGRLILTEKSNILEPVKKIGSVKITHEKMDEIAETVRQRCAELSSDELMILHAVLAANNKLLDDRGVRNENVVYMEKAAHIIHTMLLGASGSGEGPETDKAAEFLKIEKGFEPFVAGNEYQRSIFAVQNAEEFFEKIDAILNTTIRRYPAFYIDKIDYPNFSVGQVNNYTSVADARVPIEFSIVFQPRREGIDFNSENLEALRYIWRAKTAVHYCLNHKGSFDEGVNREHGTAELEDIMFIPDPLDKNKIRVKGKVVFPKYSPNIAFYLSFQTKNGKWFYGSPRRVHASVIDLNWQLIKPNIEDRIARLIANEIIVPSEREQKKLAMDELRALLVGELEIVATHFHDALSYIKSCPFKEENIINETKGIYPWRFERQFLGSELIASNGAVAESSEVMPDLSSAWLTEAYAAMLRSMDIPFTAMEKSWSYYDGIGDHYYAAHQHVYMHLAIFDKIAIDQLVHELTLFQEIADIEPYIKRDESGQAIGIYIEKLITALYKWHKEGWRSKELIGSSGHKTVKEMASAQITIKDLESMHADERSLLIGAKNYLKGIPINEMIDLSVIPRQTDKLTLRETAVQLDENLETLARMIAWNNSLGLDIRYGVVYEHDDKYEMDAVRQLKVKLERIADLPGMNLDVAKLFTLHTGLDTLEVQLRDVTSIRNMDRKSLHEKTFPVALLNDKEGVGACLPNYTGASAIGLSLAALYVTNKKGTEEAYKTSLIKVLGKLKSIYERYGVDAKGLTVDVVNQLVTSSAKVRLDIIVKFALPPVIKAAIETLNEYHKAMQLLLQSA